MRGAADDAPSVKTDCLHTVCAVHEIDPSEAVVIRTVEQQPSVADRIARRPGPVLDVRALRDDVAAAHRPTARGKVRERGDVASG